MTTEAIVPTYQVDELLGLHRPTRPVGLLPREFGVNLRRLTVSDPTSAAFGEWVDRRAVLKWMQACNEQTDGHPVLEKMIAQYREVMEL